MKLPKAYVTTIEKKTIDMTTSINPLGCSPRAVKAIRAMKAEDIASYPDQTKFLIRASSVYGVAPNMLLLGNGSEQLIKLISSVFIRGNSRVAVEAGSFFLFSREPILSGGTVRFFDFETAKNTPKRPKLLFMANPTTPGGIDRSSKAIRRVLDTIEPVFAVVDEANGEFSDNSLIAECKKRTNLIVLRTFSKAFGLAGLRIGMAVANPTIIETLREFQQPFAVSSAAIAAAQAALTDCVFLKKTKTFITSERRLLTKELKKNNFTVSKSVTNNLFVSRNDAAQIIQKLSQLNVSVIDGTYFPGNTQTGFRISLRDKQTNRAFLRQLLIALACLKNKKLLGSKERI